MARYAQRNDFMYHRHTCAVWSITAAAVLAYQMPLATAALRAAESSARARGSAAAAVPGRTQAELRGTVLSKETRQPVPCTVTILDSNGQTVTDGKGYRWGFRSSGVFTKLLPPGRTKVRITRGPEFRAMEREVELRAGAVTNFQVELERQVDLRRRGWFAGDSHVHMIHGEKTIPVDFDQVALAARAEDLQYLSLGHAWQLDHPTPERLEAELSCRSTPDCTLTWNLESPKNYFKGDAARCLGHCWTLGMRGRTPHGADVIAMLLDASAGDYQSQEPSLANFESHALIHAQGGSVFYTHPARWWTGAWGGQGGYPKQDKMRVSNMAVELPLDVLAGPTFDGLDIITGAHEFAADQKSFEIWSLLLNHGYRVAATASSDACFDRPGGAVPGAARLYTFVEGGFSLAAVARATAQGRTFVTTGPLVLVSVDGKPPGTALPAGNHSHELRIEAWSSGAGDGGLRRVEVLRNGQPVQKPLDDARAGCPSFQAALSIVETGTAWYCVRVFGTDERRQGAISGAFFFDERPRRPPAPVKARVRATVVEAGSGRPLDATLTEIRQVATEPQPGTQHRIQGEVAMLSILATMRLRADAVGFEPLTLSPLFDHPPLIETVTRLEDKDLVDWRTFERIEKLLRDVPLIFALKKARPE